MAGPARHRSWRTVAGLAILLATAAGCSASGSVAAPDGNAAALPDVRTISELPLNAYTLGLDELLTVHAATWSLAARCATRFGVDELVAPEPDPTVVIGMNPRRYGIDSVRDAERFGYRPAGSAVDGDVEPIA